MPTILAMDVERPSSSSASSCTSFAYSNLSNSQTSIDAFNNDDITNINNNINENTNFSKNKRTQVIFYSKSMINTHNVEYFDNNNNNLWNKCNTLLEDNKHSINESKSISPRVDLKRPDLKGK